MNAYIIFGLLIAYIAGSFLYKHLRFYAYDLIWRALIIFAVWIFLGDQVGVTETQWKIIAAVLIINLLYTVVSSPIKSVYQHIIAVIAAPLAEELMFRGFLLHYITGSDLERIGWTSLLFGLYHLKNVQVLTVRATVYQVFYATILGFPLGFLALKTDSLFLPILLHSVNNVLAHTVTAKHFPWVMKRREE